MSSGSRMPSGALGTTAFFGCIVGLVFFTVAYLLIVGAEKIVEVIGIVPAGWGMENGQALMWFAVLVAVPATIVATIKMRRIFATQDEDSVA